MKHARYMFFVWMLVGGCLGGLAMTTPTERKAILESGEAILNANNEVLAKQIEQAVPPFAYQISQRQLKKRVPKQRDLTDKEILEEVADALQPTGVMTKGNKKYLLFDENELEEGDVLKINIQGRIYRVKVAKIDNSAYTLQLNTTTYAQPLVELQSNKIRFDNP
ncbi:MAG TPA: hypothetical protein DIU37_03600 [Opitutae bacterium]|nr:hypothetical protein [Opitutae bacterium]|tara:strand:+ start:5464 stop:5958 length:495 start_codon:yes stop_codon:yes gene_type:complete